MWRRKEKLSQIRTESAQRFILHCAQCVTYMVFVVMDSMVLIHLAKISLLAACCEFFGKVMIPQKVFEETITAGKEKAFEDAFLIEKMIKENKIAVKTVKQKELLQKANQFNIFGGEAEALALYWQEKADYLASDDDNVRSKKEVLEINLLGAPAILLVLYNKNVVDSAKMLQSIQKLRKIGWFSSSILDKISEGVEKNARSSSNRD